ncbi:MAG: hypothetical protein KDA61_22675 [Planctomycetales bacterium]|nr:hypothetical protein [Planctomycetales bacterium]
MIAKKTCWALVWGWFVLNATSNATSAPVAMAKASPGSTSSQSATWSVVNGQQATLVRWRCEAFKQRDEPFRTVDARVAIAHVETSGLVRARVVRGEDATNVRKGRDSAELSILLEGPGSVTFDVTLEVDAAFCASGSYDTHIDTKLITP